MPYGEVPPKTSNNKVGLINGPDNAVTNFCDPVTEGLIRRAVFRATDHAVKLHSLFSDVLFIVHTKFNGPTPNIDRGMGPRTTNESASRLARSYMKMEVISRRGD